MQPDIPRSAWKATCCLVIVCVIVFALAMLVERASGQEVCAGFGQITRVRFIESGLVTVTDDGLLGAVQAWTTLYDNWTEAGGGYFIHQLDAVEEVLWVDTDAGRRMIIVYGSFGSADMVFPTAFPNMQTIHPCSAGIMPRAAFEAWRLAAGESE